VRPPAAAPQAQAEPPQGFSLLRPFPMRHPADRQATQCVADVDAGGGGGLGATLSAGDVLYIPQYWWHGAPQRPAPACAPPWTNTH
jgi:hypothetical protein